MHGIAYEKGPLKVFGNPGGTYTPALSDEVFDQGEGFRIRFPWFLEKIKNNTANFWKKLFAELKDKITSCRYYLETTEETSKSLIQKISDEIQETFSSEMDFNELIENPDAATEAIHIFANTLSNKKETYYKHAIDCLHGEISKNAFLKDMDQQALEHVEHFKSTCRMLAENYPDYNSVLRQMEYWVENISPTDIVISYILGGINLIGMNIFSYKLHDDSEIKKGMNLMGQMAVNAFIENAKHAVELKMDELLQTTHGQLLGFESALKAVEREWHNLIGG